MFVDLARIPAVRVPPAGVVVVGAGAAGIALAQRLEQAGRDVLLFESGGAGQFTGAGSDDLNEGTVIGQPYQGLTGGRTRTLGGAAQLWHGQCMRLHAHDLEQRPWIPGSGWPFGLPDLDPHYVAAERWLGVSGLGYGPDRWAEHRRLPPVAWSDGLVHDFTEYTARPMLGHVHRAELRSSRRVTVVLNATVGSVLLDDGGQRVRGLQVFRPDGSHFELPAARVVLAAGAIENARLLALSDRDGVGLGTGREHTGRYLQDHPVIGTATIRTDDHRFLQDRYVALRHGRRRLFPKVRLAAEVQAREGLLDATAAFIHDHDRKALAAARRLVLAARARRVPETPWTDLRTSMRTPAPVVRDAYRRYLRGLSTAATPSRVWLQVWLEQQPDPASRLRLGTATDRYGLRRVEVDWRIGDREIATSRRLTRLIAADLTRLGLGVADELAPMQDDTVWRAAATDAFHPSGTTRMADDPTRGVVDSNLQVHGVANLFVVGGSVFPIAGYANPTLTIVALALRLAGRLAAT